MERRKPSLLIAASTLTLLTGLTAGVWAFLHAASRTVRLADGSLLTLEHAGYGPTPQVVCGPLWKRRLHPLLPRPLQARLGWHYSIGGGFPDTKDAFGAVLIHTGRDPAGFIVDSHGCEISPTTWYSNVDDGHYGSIQSFRFYPRREPRFRLAIRRPPHEGFVVSNPTHAAYPVWPPEAFPVTKHAGDTAFTLLDFTTGSADEWGVSRLRARYRVAQAGAPAPEWRPVSAHLSDATGGALQYEHLRQPGSGTFELGGAVCREESYRLRVEFSRYEDPRARPDAVWTARGVPLRRAVTVRPGVTLVIEPSNIVMGSITAPKPGLRFRLRGTDQNGRPFRFAPARWGSSTKQAFVLVLERDARLLDVRIEVFRSRYAEFTVKPTSAPTGPAQAAP